MFQTLLPQPQPKLSSSPQSHTPTFTHQPPLDLDLQYQLYARYLHISKQQLLIQELNFIKDSQILLESIQFSAKADLSRDVHSTMDSVCCDDDFENSLVHEFSAIEKRTPKKITRKTNRHHILKPTSKSTDEFTDILNEIERNCTENTFLTLKSLIQQHKRNLIRIIDVEKKQKNIKRLEEKNDKLEQQNAIFRIKLTEVEQKIRSKDDEIKSLKEKLNQHRINEKQNIRLEKWHASPLSKSIDDSLLSSPYQPHCQNSTASTYLHQKQAHLKQRFSTIQRIETRIEELIESSVLNAGNSEKEESCSKCCNMIRKIKSSVMQYRQYLEMEGDECERLYNMLRVEVDHCLTDRNLEISNV